MNITKDYIQSNASYSEQSYKAMVDLLQSRGLNEEDYIIIEFNYIFYATHTECFTIDYYNDYQEYNN